SQGDVAQVRLEEHRPLQGVQALRRGAVTAGQVRTVGDRERPNLTSRDLLGAGLVEQLLGSRSCMLVGACLSTPRCPIHQLDMPTAV
ncbi:hypothetical protein CSHISOI_02536, partial [Colletotrichum shisoi]